jgi:hypothetical protein
MFRNSTRCRRGWALGVAACALAAGCAAHTGGQATQGALEALRAPPPEGTPSVGGRVGRDVTEGALAEIASPDGLASVAMVVDAAVTRSMEAALRGPEAHGRYDGAPAARSLVERMSRDAAAAFATGFSEELERALGPDGRGPLAASVNATVAHMSGAAMQGARGELGGLFEGCEGGDRRACVEQGVRALGKAAAQGFVEGVVGSGAWPLAALAFVAGILGTLGVTATWRLLRAGRPEPRKAHP